MYSLWSDTDLLDRFRTLRDLGTRDARDDYENLARQWFQKAEEVLAELVARGYDRTELIRT